MIRLTLVITRKAGTSVEDFRRHYENLHAPLVTRHFPKIAEYKRHYRDVDAKLDISNQDWDCITESIFENEDDYAAFVTRLQIPEVGEEIFADGELFMYNSRTLMFVHSI
jgi:hypothetical protein